MIARDNTVTVAADDSDAYRWDWSATTHEPAGTGLTARELVTDLVTACDPLVVLPGKGLQGWEKSVEVYNGDGNVSARVYWGGSRTDVHVASTSEAAHVVRPRVASMYGAKTARVDTRVDTRRSFSELVDIARDTAGPRTKLTFMASEVGGESTGRTLYVGSPTSDVRVRIYEKHLESPGSYDDEVNRVEVQFRPPSRGKLEVSERLPGETFCATKLTRRLAIALGQDVYKPVSVQKPKQVPDLERTLEAMGKQYGPAVDRFLSVSGGDVDAVLRRLRVLGFPDED